MTNSTNPLVEMVRRGAVAALREVGEAAPGDPLVGFALLTDDDLSGVFHVACTAQFAASTSLDNLRFLPTDWTQCARSEPPGLVDAEQYLSGQLSLEERHREPEDDLRALVAGLVAARREAEVDESVFMTVGSTDPCALMERLEEEAVAQLNGPSVLRAWHEWHIAEARNWLNRIERKSPPLTYADEDNIQRLRAEIVKRETLLRGRLTSR